MKNDCWFGICIRICYGILDSLSTRKSLENHFSQFQFCHKTHAPVVVATWSMLNCICKCIEPLQW